MMNLAGLSRRNLLESQIHIAYRSAIFTYGHILIQCQCHVLCPSLSDTICYASQLDEYIFLTSLQHDKRISCQKQGLYMVLVIFTACFGKVLGP